LITTNCAVLGIALINTSEGFQLLESLVSAIGAGVGFTLVLVIMSGIRENLDTADIPEAFKGLPIAFIVGALLALTFIGFGGIL
jgi:Na+-translocating ferredoxin:NAD+ oxidoreductase subunit A